MCKQKVKKKKGGRGNSVPCYLNIYAVVTNKINLLVNLFIYRYICLYLHMTRVNTCCVDINVHLKYGDRLTKQLV